MCDHCKQLDIKLEQYRRIASSITDGLTISRINKAIEEAVAKKAGLHLDQKERLASCRKLAREYTEGMTAKNLRELTAEIEQEIRSLDP
jgi:hypothetical protein